MEIKTDLIISANKRERRTKYQEWNKIQCCRRMSVGSLLEKGESGVRGKKRISRQFWEAIIILIGKSDPSSCHHLHHHHEHSS